MSKAILTTLVLIVAFGSIDSASAFYTPISVGLAPPVQFPPSDFNVSGVRISGLWGRHRDMYGLDFGVLGNITDQDFVGLGISGIFNLTNGTTTAIGLQAAGLANINTKTADVYGLQIAGLLNRNVGGSNVNGVQIAAVNLADHTVVRGIQAGLYNRAQVVYGLQIGVVNVATNLHGLQIGLANFHQKGLFVVSPILNFGW